jgi:putative transposase
MSPPRLDLALKTSGLDQAKPRLLSDNGSSYIAADLAKWLDGQNMEHVRGAPYHPMTQGKIERWRSVIASILTAPHPAVLAMPVSTFGYRPPDAAYCLCAAPRFGSPSPH